MLVWSLQEYEWVVNPSSDPKISRPASEHRMDLRSVDGLLGVVTLGNLLEFLSYLDSRYHTGNMPQAEQAEADCTRLAFTRFKGLFCASQHLIVGTRKADPMTELFDLSTLRFAVTLVKYKEKKAALNNSFTPLQLKQCITKHISEFHPRLLPRFEHDVQSCSVDLPYLRSFDWIGPKFTIAEGPYPATTEKGRRTDISSFGPDLGVRTRKRCDSPGKPHL